jgi:hypothetical protein
LARVGQGLAGDVEAALGLAQLEIVARHFRRQTHLQVGQIGLSGLHVGAGGFGGPPLAAEQVQFPAGIEAGTGRFAESRAPPALGTRLGAARPMRRG